ncbi:DoxX family protein [Silvimonas sp.]|uniref:DoxX family protein n=1 Tax=Silvimonas sp. TaxID=2650811 RepID=UPI00284775E7|nr:DoxX family protein [Silvimonas sp.]MDR3428765.1 DoxX family protein [Silvimonas sp.]
MISFVEYGPSLIAGLTLLARLLLSLVFLDSAWHKLNHWQDSVTEVRALKLPHPQLMVALTITAQALGGLAVATGAGARVGALILAGFTLLATFLGHNFLKLAGKARINQETTFLEHMSIVGGMLMLAVCGPGAWSLHILFE